VLLDTGRGVKQDFTEAAKWYRTAAERGHAVAQLNLGSLFELGQGVLKDPAEAVKWYRKAAELKEPRAEHALGICYAEGNGVAQDMVEAYKWLSLAAAHGYAPAVVTKGTIESKLTPDQKAKGQELVASALDKSKAN
jgi:TPR repeat protein